MPLLGKARIEKRNMKIINNEIAVIFLTVYTSL